MDCYKVLEQHAGGTSARNLGPKRLLISSRSSPLPSANIPLPFFTLIRSPLRCPCICTICTTTIPSYSPLLLFRLSVRVRKARGSVRIFARRTNALRFTPKNGLIDARSSLLRLCSFTLFIHCASFTSVSPQPASSSTTAFPHFPSSFFLTFPISSTSTLCHHQSSYRPPYLASFRDHHCITTLMHSI